MTSGNTIYSILKTGGALTWRASGQDVITSMTAKTLGAAQFTDVAWTEQRGLVSERKLVHPGTSGTDGPTGFLNVPSAGLTSSSVVREDNYDIAWITCTSPGNSSCSGYIDGQPEIIAGVGARFMQLDATQMFWGDGGSVKRAAITPVLGKPPVRILR